MFCCQLTHEKQALIQENVRSTFVLVALLCKITSRRTSFFLHTHTNTHLYIHSDSDERVLSSTVIVYNVVSIFRLCRFYFVYDIRFYGSTKCTYLCQCTYLFKCIQTVLHICLYFTISLSYAIFNLPLLVIYHIWFKKNQSVCRWFNIC